MYLTIARSTAGWICDRSCVGYLTLSLSLSLSLPLSPSPSLSLSLSLSLSPRLSPSLPSLSLSLSPLYRVLSLSVPLCFSIYICLCLHAVVLSRHDRSKLFTTRSDGFTWACFWGDYPTLSDAVGRSGVPG